MSHPLVMLDRYTTWYAIILLCTIVFVLLAQSTQMSVSVFTESEMQQYYNQVSVMYLVCWNFQCFGLL
jgi:hypothetical protein